MLVYNSNLSILGNVEIVWKWRQVLKRSLLIANSFCVYTILYRIRLNNQFPRTESQIFDSMQNKIPWIWFNFGLVIAETYMVVEYACFGILLFWRLKVSQFSQNDNKELFNNYYTYVNQRFMNNI